MHRSEDIGRHGVARPAGTTAAWLGSSLSGPRRGREIWLAYLLLTPALLLVFGILAYPAAWEVWVSLTNRSTFLDEPSSFIGLRNYLALLHDAEFWRALAVTALYCAITMAAKLVLGTATALLLARRFPGRALVFLAAFLPWAYPGSVAVMGWYWTLNPPLVTSYSLFLGQVKWLVNSHLGSGAYEFLSVVLFNVWRGGSFTAIFLLAGLTAIPPELFEYAALECRSVWRRLWLVTVPLLRPYLALAAFLSLTTALADLTNVWMLTGGRIVFPIIGTEAYWRVIIGGQVGAGAALTLSLVPVLALVLTLLFRLFDRPGEDAA